MLSKNILRATKVSVYYEWKLSEHRKLRFYYRDCGKPFNNNKWFIVDNTLPKPERIKEIAETSAELLVIELPNREEGYLVTKYLHKGDFVKSTDFRTHYVKRSKKEKVEKVFALVKTGVIDKLKGILR